MGIYNYHLFSTIDDTTFCFSTVNFKILLTKYDSQPWFARSVTHVTWVFFFFFYVDKEVFMSG